MSPLPESPLRIHTAPRGRVLLRRELTESPALLRKLAQIVLIALPLVALVALLLPWQQSASGYGEVVAYQPQERAQMVESPIDGRIVAWRVTEGDHVSEGDVLLVLGDNDPQRLERLTLQREQLSEELAAAQRQVNSKHAAWSAKSAAAAQVSAEYDAKVAELERKKVAEEATLATAKLNLDRVSTLRDEGISSGRDFELVTLDHAKAEAAVAARALEIEAVRRAGVKALASADAEVAVALAETEEARAKVASLQGKLTEMDSKVAKQASQEVRAPRDGVVLRMKGAPVGGQVKSGDELVELVPQAEQVVVALKIKGADLPWVSEGDPVRLVFEGIPAVQWVGPPGDGIGTYPGRVVLVDATGVDGEFRVLVEPEHPEAWPALRQGVQARGYVLIGQVKLGWELWRRINGFPPTADGDGSLKPPSAKKPRAPELIK